VSFEKVLSAHPWKRTQDRIRRRTGRHVEAALCRDNPSAEDLAALLSPAAEPFLEKMARRAHMITRHRFGRVIQMYAPLYLSNECTNSCIYCGFSRKHDVVRRTLSSNEAVKEAELLHKTGFRHILLVSGESPKHVDTAYLESLARALEGRFASLSIEVQPLKEENYRRLINAGVDGLVSYQETYNRRTYEKLHPFGPKRDFSFRVNTPDRGGSAGLRRVGIGALLGLSDWRVEGFLVGLHAAYIQKKHWRTQVSVSFPRLCPTFGGFASSHPVDDRALVQLICALRIVLPDCLLVLSTRERAGLRDHLVPLGINQMSAGSRTEPGGYTHAGDAEEQFAIHDSRQPSEVADSVVKLGYEPVWKDWDSTFLVQEPENKAGSKREGTVP